MNNNKKMESHNLFYLFTFTIYISLVVQILAAIFNFAILNDHLPESEKIELRILLDLLGLGLFIQVVEGTFYLWLVNKYKVIQNITPYRYYDWFITTPTMLVVLIVYLCFLNNRELVPNNSKIPNAKKETLFEIVNAEKSIIGVVLILNALMLFFGYMGELGVIKEKLAVFLGFIPFIIYFSMIYYNYARYTEKGLIVFWLLTTIWALYGVAALMPYFWKNISYNILDLFSKNFFECYLGYILWYNIV